MLVDRRHTQLGDSFVAEDLRQMRVATRYTDWLHALVRPHVGRRILEVGCGIGTMTTRLLEHADAVFGIEPNADCAAELDALRERYEKDQFDYRVWRIEESDMELLHAKAFDTILCINVLEHIEHDVEAVRTFAEILRPTSGRMVLLVPAVPQAYGRIDSALGHFRRYSKRGLADVLRKAGVDVELVRYSNTVGLLGWLYNARLGGRVKQSDVQIKMFDRGIVPWLSRLEALIEPPVGLSLVAVGRA